LIFFSKQSEYAFCFIFGKYFSSSEAIKLTHHFAETGSKSFSKILSASVLIHSLFPEALKFEWLKFADSITIFFVESETAEFFPQIIQAIAKTFLLSATTISFSDNSYSLSSNAIIFSQFFANLITIFQSILSASNI